MSHLKTILHSPVGILLSAGFAWFSIKYLPSPMMIVWLFAAMGVNLITGILKAWEKGEFTKSTGLEKTVKKVLIYSSTIVMVIILVNMLAGVSNNYSYNLTVAIDGLFSLIIIIELVSVCENIEEAYPNGALTKFFITPLLKLLRARLKNPFQSDKNQNNDADPGSKGQG